MSLTTSASGLDRHRPLALTVIGLWPGFTQHEPALQQQQQQEPSLQQQRHHQQQRLMATAADIIAVVVVVVAVAVAVVVAGASTVIQLLELKGLLVASMTEWTAECGAQLSKMCRLLSDFTPLLLRCGGGGGTGREVKVTS